MSDIWIEILKGLIAIVAPILSILLVALLRKALQKAGIEENKALDELVEKHVKTAVNYVEKVAVTKLGDVKGEGKAALAVKTVMDELNKAGITKVGEEYVRHKIESYLFEKKETANLKV
jgi:hypothetical protein